jgi:hypothetical protein
MITKVLTEERRSHYLREIRADTAYFGRTFNRADLTVDINGLDIEACAEKTDDMLRKWPAEPGRRSR